MVTKGKQSGSSTQEARDLLEADVKAFLESGKKITQSYDEFFEKWNVNEPWLHYNAIAFNTDNKKLNIKLEKYYDQ